MLPWSSVFSENVSATLHMIESWISSMFFVLFLITIGPWFAFLIYDVILYVFRTITYEIPIIGGRARGRERPRAPSLKERATGDPRVMGIGVPAATYVEQEDVEEEGRHSTVEVTSNDEEDEEAEIRPPEHDTSETIHHTDERPKNELCEPTELSDAQKQIGEDEEVGTTSQQVDIGGREEGERWPEVNTRRRTVFTGNDDQI
ncbi:uncharacterized protein PV09_01275 [Verruconis gallopava]|uniref:Uncharacterized protein n=1 Tax=Verruconis gallopava TaxID=253628 RepID=A0A0D2BAK5_9PEZI|nr:uncharacterized protein PV09_01275 [Verruconis gallopava]KIW08359.1 hypothetical protein PV09_01275 [Verruconis gallopava]